MILRYHYLNEKTMFSGRSYGCSHFGFWRDSGEKTSCFVDVCNGNLTLWTYLGIKLIEIDTYDVYSTYIARS